MKAYSDHELTCVCLDANSEAQSSEGQSKAVSALERDGVVVLRGLYDSDFMEQLVQRFAVYFARPSVSGAVGYAQLSHAKTATSAFTLGGPIVKMMIQHQLIEIIESYMASKCVLAEATAKHDRGVGYTYFPMHADFSAGWKKSPTATFELTAEEMKKPVGVGVALYLHDTTEGAFCYSVGSHKLEAKEGVRLARYPADLQQQITSNIVRCDGRRGDLVVFDDRGFHGPDQPSKTDRSVILLDYYREDTFGHTVVTPHPIWSSDLAGLTLEEMHTLGVGASYMVPPENHVKTRYSKNIFYNLITRMIKMSYFHTHLKYKIKEIIGNN